jgi:hypothetical protein
MMRVGTVKCSLKGRRSFMALPQPSLEGIFSAVRKRLGGVFLVR